MSKAIVIGAGIAGIASAVRLALKGYQVDVYESNAYPGGKLSEFEQDGFRFDAGPSLFTMPQYVEELFKLAGELPQDYFQYEKLDEVCRYFWDDGTHLTAWADVEKFADEIAAKTTSKREEIFTFLAKSKQIYEITNHVFLEKSLHKLATFLNIPTLKSVLRLPKIDAFRSMAKANESFFSDKKMIQYANRYATYNGSNPYQAPATLNVIPHLEQHFGAYFPKKGMFDITLSLVNLAERLGVKFHYNSYVEQILVENKETKGIIINAKKHFADVVVSNMDVYFTYKNLLKDEKQPQQILKQERSSSALIFYWGVKKQFKELGLHNIFFSDDYQKEFNTIFKEKAVDDDPTVYINITSKLKADDAPEGCENWFTMINVPNNIGQDWDTLIAKAKLNIIKKLNKNLKINLDELIVTEAILDPRTIESKSFSYQGSLYGTSSNNQFAAFLRHANFSSKIKNLYFTGGSVHPGGGIPLALLSAKIVGEMIPSTS
ncbi:1-hydroxycarotenoid 3,4-desaturase CrtD [Pedobacter puniceum]|uniref:Phytoene desaturase n=1 Tax=Pedobacter puniceum TaxID=2666136 RepID=A0A7K0FPQ0_9SPHI|nr:1-hydroxycarotenoid 3,4-desaturase CrtD [Pedobacter puniceum]MRX47949.1 phytoene desaturase [Pedobacter puniceum]